MLLVTYFQVASFKIICKTEDAKLLDFLNEFYETAILILYTFVF